MNEQEKYQVQNLNIFLYNIVKSKKYLIFYLSKFSIFVLLTKQGFDILLGHCGVCFFLIVEKILNIFQIHRKRDQSMTVVTQHDGFLFVCLQWHVPCLYHMSHSRARDRQQPLLANCNSHAATSVWAAQSACVRGWSCVLVCF